MPLENYSDQQKLDCVKQSPAAVAVHDKATWLGLFSADGLVNDPVGSKPHQGREAIDRFYETFIAPNKIIFDVEHDVVCGDTVVRDLIIETTMSTGLKVDVPTFIRYELVEEGGVLKVNRLYAHWELAPMVMQTLKAGLSGLVTYSKLSVHMIKCQGMGGVMGFMQGFGGVGGKGKARAEKLMAALRDLDWEAANEALGSEARLDMPDSTDMDFEPFARLCEGLRWKKVLAAGQTVTAAVEQGGRRGLALFLFNNKGEIAHVRFYY